jgi:hypothetical protein
MQPEMPKDYRGESMQVARWGTADSFTLDGSSAADTSSAFETDDVVRLQSDLTADSWIKIGTSVIAVSGEGTLFLANSGESIKVLEGDVISVIGGIVNVTPYRG